MKKIGEQTAYTIDKHIFGILKNGSTIAFASDGTISTWQNLKYQIKLRIKWVRHSIANWVGGEDLHEYCDY